MISRKFRRKSQDQRRRRFLLILVLVFLLVFVLPTLISQERFQPAGQVVLEEEEQTMLRVLNHQTGEVMSLGLEEYIQGVISGEMPVSFELEALKVQAITARTYAMKRLELYGTKPNPDHPQSELCTDSRHCQNWKSEAEMKEIWGKVKYPLNHLKIATAVGESVGLVITYQGKLIDPVYHSTCGGQTENAEDVWASAIPYLRSVACKWDKQAPRYTEELRLTWSQVSSNLGLPLAVPAATGKQESLSATQSKALNNLLQVQGKSPTGRVKTVKVGDQVLSATEFRSRLGLNSTRIAWEVNAEGVVFRTQGYGHGVGLCQYGANGQAQSGKSAIEIIRYYYQQVEVRKIGS